MKKSLLAVALMGAVAAAHAQGNVTLYGVIDEGIDYTNSVATANGGHSVLAMSANDLQVSAWGLKGSEELGGGLSTVFRLESGINVNNGKLGQEGQIFGREAWVGLASKNVGTLTFGRQYDSLTDVLAPLTANGNWGGTMFSHPFDNDQTDGTFRMNNAVKFTSSDYNGLSFTGAYGFSNSSNFASNRAESLGAQYVYGGLTASVAYLYAGGPNSNSTGAVAIGPNGSGDGSWSADNQQVFGAGVNYALGAAVLGLVYTHTNIKNPTATQYADFAASAKLGAASSLKFDNIELNGTYAPTPTLTVGGMYDFTAMNYGGATGSGKPKYHTLGVIADYNLSKRTDVYVQGAYVHVQDASSVAGSGLDVASNVDGASSSTANQAMARVGLRTKF